MKPMAYCRGDSTMRRGHGVSRRLPCGPGLIFERTSRSAKTHRGVSAELHRLTKDKPRMDIDLRAFLGRTYNLEAIADYETGPGSEVSAEMATDAVGASRRFVAAMAALVDIP